LITGELHELFRWFALTHELEVSTVGTAGARWRLVRLPDAGSLADQDAKLMFGLEYLRGIENELIHEEWRKGDPNAELEAFKQE
jgi:hypothetical protein